MTYNDLIGNIRAVVAEESRLALLSDDSIKIWINDAIQKLSEQLPFPGEFDVELSEDKAQYLVSDYIDHEIRRIITAETNWSGFTRVLTVEDISSLAEFKERETYLIAAFTDFSAPSYLARYRDSQDRSILHFYPPPVSDELTVKIYYEKLFPSEFFHSKDFSDEISIPREYQSYIQWYATSLVYLWLKEVRLYREFQRLFWDELRLKKRQLPFVKRKRMVEA